MRLSLNFSIIRLKDAHVPPFLPLDCLARGEWAEIVAVDGDCGWANRFAELGVRAGVRVQMIEPGSPCLFAIGPARLSARLGEHLQILVQPILESRVATSEVA